MQTKTQKLKNYWQRGDLKKSLQIFRTFKIGISSQQKRAVQITYESMTGKSGFYKSIGVDLDKMKSTAIQTIEEYLK